MSLVISTSSSLQWGELSWRSSWQALTRWYKCCQFDWTEMLQSNARSGCRCQFISWTMCHRLCLQEGGAHGKPTSKTLNNMQGERTLTDIQKVDNTQSIKIYTAESHSQLVLLLWKEILRERRLTLRVQFVWFELNMILLRLHFLSVDTINSNLVVFVESILIWKFKNRWLSFSDEELSLGVRIWAFFIIKTADLISLS